MEGVKVLDESIVKEGGYEYSRRRTCNGKVSGLVVMFLPSLSPLTFLGTEERVGRRTYDHHRTPTARYTSYVKDRYCEKLADNRR